jgi:superfamily II DNA helicase RecQ
MAGIIYCVSASDVVKVHGELNKRDISCVKYQSQLADAIKQESVHNWQTDECTALVANASFGMGIDKANVRYVIHARLPTSVEEYYQQCGRAGRDGQKALCIIYYSYSDKSVLYKLFRNQSENFELQRQSLNDLIGLIEDAVRCRHQMIMKFFGEERESFRCVTSCDNCRMRGQFYNTDGTADALKVLQTIVELGDKNCNTLKLILAGSRQKSLQQHGYDTLASFGCLTKQFSCTLLEKFLHSLIQQKIIGENIVQVAGNNLAVYIKLGEKAHDVLAARASVLKIKKS